MLRRRVQQHAEIDPDCDMVVIDGNCKTSRRICGEGLSEILFSKPLGKYTAVQCSATCAYKKRRCDKHVAEIEAPLPPEPSQSEVIVGHRRERVLASSASTALYHVCLVSREHKDVPNFPKRWVWLLFCLFYKNGIMSDKHGHLKFSVMFGCSEAFCKHARRCNMNAMKHQTHVTTKASAASVTRLQLREYWSQHNGGVSEPVRTPAQTLALVSCKTHKESLALRQRTHLSTTCLAVEQIGC